MLTDFASAMQKLSREGVRDFGTLFARGVDVAQVSLARTPELLDSLRKANVVDAGAQGFVDLVACIQDYLEHGHDHEPMLDAIAVLDARDEETAGREEDLEYRYCTECVVEGVAIDRRKLRERLAQLGGSLVVAGLQSKVRLHIHVHDPAELFRVAREFGTVGREGHDMQRQQHAARDGPQGHDHHGLGRTFPKTTRTASTSTVPVRVHFGDRSYLDRSALRPRSSSRNRGSPQPKTRAPPGDFRLQFGFSTHYESVLSSTSRGVSGRSSRPKRRQHAPPPMASARARLHECVRWRGLVVMFAAERAQVGIARRSDRCDAEDRCVDRTFGLVGSLEHPCAAGACHADQSAADALQLMPVLHNTGTGHIKRRRAVRSRNSRRNSRDTC